MGQRTVETTTNEEQAGQTPAATALRLSGDENARFLRIIKASSHVTRHYELFLLLQGEVQEFIPHQIMLCGWGDFRGSRLNLDVVSPLVGVRTVEASGCGAEGLLRELHSRWVANARRPLVLDHARCEPVAPSVRECCGLQGALRSMRWVLVHGIHDKRDGIDTLYVALNPRPVANGRSVERFFHIVDSLIPQINIAYRNVAPLQIARPADQTQEASPSQLITAREREVLQWMSEGKTNIEIAAILGVSRFTAKNHVQRIIRKLGVANRMEAVAKYGAGA